MRLEGADGFTSSALIFSPWIYLYILHNQRYKKLRLKRMACEKNLSELQVLRSNWSSRAKWKLIDVRNVCKSVKNVFTLRFHPQLITECGLLQKPPAAQRRCRRTHKHPPFVKSPNKAKSEGCSLLVQYECIKYWVHINSVGWSEAGPLAESLCYLSQQ